MAAHPSIAFSVAPLVHTAGMSFGQSSGPPATAAQVQQLLELLHLAGHTDFRDARGPMGFSQRQAAGKFTRTEAEAFIEQLEAAQEAAGSPGASGGRSAATPPARTPTVAPPAPARAAPRPAANSTEQMLRTVPTTILAAELQRRGWVVLEP